nr:MAG TPA: hypothetical protein [Herelleviridae sp.]
MNVTINKKLAKSLGLEEAIVYQYLLDNINDNKEVSLSFMELTKSIDLFNINVVKTAVSNLIDADIISKTYYCDDFENMTMTIKILNIV